MLDCPIVLGRFAFVLLCRLLIFFQVIASYGRSTDVLVCLLFFSYSTLYLPPFSNMIFSLPRSLTDSHVALFVSSATPPPFLTLLCANLEVILVLLLKSVGDSPSVVVARAAFCAAEAVPSPSPLVASAQENDVCYQRIVPKVVTVTDVMRTNDIRNDTPLLAAEVPAEKSGP